MCVYKVNVACPSMFEEMKKKKTDAKFVELRVGAITQNEYKLANSEILYGHSTKMVLWYWFASTFLITYANNGRLTPLNRRPFADGIAMI